MTTPWRCSSHGEARRHDVRAEEDAAILVTGGVLCDGVGGFERDGRNVSCPDCSPRVTIGLDNEPDDEPRGEVAEQR
jgi:hypothetical protein